MIDELRNNNESETAFSLSKELPHYSREIERERERERELIKTMRNNIKTESKKK
jgi:hypothetical protein